MNLIDKLLCLLGLHRWCYIDSEETLRMCGRQSCNHTQDLQRIDVAYGMAYGHAYQWKDL